MNRAPKFMGNFGWLLVGRLIVFLYLVGVCNEFIGNRTLFGIAQILGIGR